MSSFATCLESEQFSTKAEPLLLTEGYGMQGAYPAIAEVSEAPATSGTAPRVFVSVHLAETAQAFAPFESELSRLEEEAQNWARGIEVPNTAAIEEARAVLGRLQAQL